ncbi:GNAT family N-acetyltransferase [Enterococcus sp. ALS3]|uniref:GNAT family N-acetyltransferase n=2 Tax=Enterococcus TaxID=1350 RepID=A0ABS6TES6_9ENTE|nr:GNAT family N-acetyltransferase [Enterococcus alishanensis]MBV7391401.1 GNAT family N-acetyltransferase [Enterococcus alishanensis]
MAQTELIEIFQERVAVFVVEQECPYQEVDEYDAVAWHVLLKDEGKLKAYARIIEKEDHVTFGRVLVVKAYRGEKWGKKIVAAAIEETKKRFPDRKIQISGQAYLKKFYQSFGFEIVSDIYLEDGIPHLELILND